MQTVVEKVCYLCHRAGHVKKYCPSRANATATIQEVCFFPLALLLFLWRVCQKLGASTWGWWGWVGKIPPAAAGSPNPPVDQAGAEGASGTAGKGHQYHPLKVTHPTGLWGVGAAGAPAQNGEKLGFPAVYSATVGGGLVMAARGLGIDGGEASPGGQAFGPGAGCGLAAGEAGSCPARAGLGQEPDQDPRRGGSWIRLA